MKEDLIFDALNEISDKYIAEAVTYEPKVKVFKLKSVLTAAACLIVVAVSALALLNGIGKIVYVNPTESSTSAPILSDSTTANYAPTMQPTTAAGTTQSGNAYASTTLKWEEKDRGLRYPTAEYGGISYGAFESATIDKSKISVLLGKIECSGYDEKSVLRKETAEIYEIAGVHRDYAVALTFKEDEEKAFYVYINKNLTALTLGEVAENFNFSENLTVPYYIFYYKEGQICKDYTMDDELYNAFIKLIENSSETKGENKERKSVEEYMSISAEILGDNFGFTFTVDGNLFLEINSNTLCFNIGTEAYGYLKSLIEARAAEVVTQRVLETTPTTEPVYTFKGSTVEIPSGYEEKNSGTTVTCPPYIPEGIETEN